LYERQQYRHGRTRHDVVPDDATAVATARMYLSYFQGRSGDVREHDQAIQRSVIPENRARAYDVRTVIEVLADAATIRHSARLFHRDGEAPGAFLLCGPAPGIRAGRPGDGGGSVHAPEFTVAWPTGEFGSMGFEGLVRLGYRKELASIADAGDRDRYFGQQLALLRDRSKAVNAASHFELDDVIDPAATRSWIVSGLKVARTRGTAPEPYLDPW
jgi:acetyl-CoA carboxylase carboxyltransferase component